MKAPQAYPLGYVEDAFMTRTSWGPFSASCYSSRPWTCAGGHVASTAVNGSKMV